MSAPPFVGRLYPPFFTPLQRKQEPYFIHITPPDQLLSRLWTEISPPLRCPKRPLNKIIDIHKILILWDVTMGTMSYKDNLLYSNIIRKRVYHLWNVVL
jgi:hypothetical protein